MWGRVTGALLIGIITTVRLSAEEPIPAPTLADATAKGCLVQETDAEKIICLQQRLDDLAQTIELYRDGAEREAATTRQQLQQALADGIYAPPKVVQRFDNILATTEMWWGGHKFHGATNFCYDKLLSITHPETLTAPWDKWFQEHVPKGSAFFVSEKTQDNSIGCKTGPTCDSQGEHCVTHRLIHGCFVNQEWLDWYQRHTTAVGLPLSKEFVCADPPNKKQ